MSNKYAFTLVELIVVVTILAILATIGFVSYSGYLTGVRDTNRIASLTAISDGLELYRTKNDLPDPDDAIDIQVEGVDIAHQGYVGSNVLQTIEYSKAGKDPKDDSYYSYYLTDDKKHYQLMAFLEESDNLDTHHITSTSHAASDYKNRYPKVYGKKLGILTDTNNSPVQEVTTGTLNFTGGTTSEYTSRFTDSDILTASGQTLAMIAPNASCKRIKQIRGGSKSGNYTINPTGTGTLEVYCNMTLHGGGWTLAFDAIDDTIMTDLTLSYNIINSITRGEILGLYPVDQTYTIFKAPVSHDFFKDRSVSEIDPIQAQMYSSLTNTYYDCAANDGTSAVSSGPAIYCNPTGNLSNMIRSHWSSTGYFMYFNNGDPDGFIISQTSTTTSPGYEQKVKIYVR